LPIPADDGNRIDHAHLELLSTLLNQRLDEVTRSLNHVLKHDILASDR
jgi:hypothetical protein